MDSSTGLKLQILVWLATPFLTVAVGCLCARMAGSLFARRYRNHSEPHTAHASIRRA